jgi:hypothetical protein
LYIYCVVRKTIRTMMAVQNFELFSNFQDKNLKIKNL